MIFFRYDYYYYYHYSYYYQHLFEVDEFFWGELVLTVGDYHRFQIGAGC